MKDTKIAREISHFATNSALIRGETIFNRKRNLSGAPNMTIDLTESEFLARDAHIISMIRDLEEARATIKA